MSPRLRLLRVPLAALALHLLGCQPAAPKADDSPAPRVETGPQDRAPAAPAAPAVAAPDPAPAPPALAALMGEGTVVALVDAGSEPREPLRLALPPGQQQAMIMTMRMGMGMQVAANTMPKTGLPPIQMTMNLQVKEITADGDIRTEFSLDAIDVLPDDKSPPAIVDQLKAVLGSMTKMSGTSTITTRGIVKSAEFNVPADIDPQLRQTMDSMRQQMNQISVPFPEEALGLGARWTVTQHLEQQGMKLQQVATWEFKERSGSVIKLACTTVQSAPPQPIVAPGVPPGAVVTLDHLNSTGSGTTEVDLTRIAPIRGTMKTVTSIAMTTEANGAKMPLTLDMDLDVDTSSK